MRNISRRAPLLRANGALGAPRSVRHPAGARRRPDRARRWPTSGSCSPSARRAVLTTGRLRCLVGRHPQGRPTAVPLGGSLARSCPCGARSFAARPCAGSVPRSPTSAAWLFDDEIQVHLRQAAWITPRCPGFTRRNATAEEILRRSNAAAAALSQAEHRLRPCVFLGARALNIRGRGASIRTRHTTGRRCSTRQLPADTRPARVARYVAAPAWRPPPKVAPMGTEAPSPCSDVRCRG
jgi:hypothetical protein